MSRETEFKYSFPANIVDREGMVKLIRLFWRKNRTAVNPKTEIFAHYLKDLLSADLIEAKSGEECLTWQVPMNWTVHGWSLKDKTGFNLIGDNPLYLWAHSVGCRETLTKEALMNQVYTDSTRPDEIPYHYRNGYRYGAAEWGLSLPYNFIQQMSEGLYRVEIDADLDNKGKLQVVDAFLPGESKETIFFAAHTCHPAQVADGIANIAVLIELYSWLEQLPQRRYSYEFIFSPEMFGAVVYLAKQNRALPKYGIYLDFISNHEPIAMQHSVQKDTKMDWVVQNVLKYHARTFLEDDYRDWFGNDETIYGGAGFDIPVIGLARGPYREYHSSADNIDNMDFYHMEEGLWFLQRIVEVFESDFSPKLLYNGPLYLSRYGLYVDPTVNRPLARNVEKMQQLASYGFSCLEIAHELEMDFFTIRDFFRKLMDKKLAKGSLIE